MYQYHATIELNGAEVLKSAKKDFDSLKKEFDDKYGWSITRPDNAEWDMAAFYRPNWACGWNKPANIHQECIILQKDDRIALVIFKNDNVFGSDKIYRLEDLSKI